MTVGNCVYIEYLMPGHAVGEHLLLCQKQAAFLAPHPLSQLLPTTAGPRFPL